MRVVHHDPAYTVPDNHRLGHIAQLEPVGTVKHFILHFARGGIVVGKRGIAVLEIPLVGNEKSDKMAQILNVPEDYELVCFLPVGIAESNPIHPQKKTFEERAWFNSYNQSN